MECFFNGLSVSVRVEAVVAVGVFADRIVIEYSVSANFDFVCIVVSRDNGYTSV